MLFMQILATSSTYKALHTPWCLSILVGWVSLAEYLLVLRVSFPLLQIALCIMATARTALLLKWMRTRTMRNGHSDGLNLSNSCVSIAFLFSITRISTDQSTFMGYPLEDYQRYSIDSWHAR